MKTLVLGLGNPILTDDSVGHRVAEEVRSRFDSPEIMVAETSLSGLSLLDLMAGYDRVIIVDAIQTVEGRVGQIYHIEPEVFDSTRHAASPHDVNFATVLELGHRLKLDIPQQIDIFAIEVADTSTFSEECTPEIKKAVPDCAAMIMELLERERNA